jgi:hypothetical protein
MKKFLAVGCRVVFAAVIVAVAASATRAQQPPVEPAPATAPHDGWYYRPAPERDAKPTLAQQKAELRGAQRMARMDAMRWYGMSASRPTASALAWTTMYSPAWQMPGGRPYAWYTSSRPVVIISTPTPVYR